MAEEENRADEAAVGPGNQKKPYTESKDLLYTILVSFQAEEVLIYGEKILIHRERIPNPL